MLGFKGYLPLPLSPTPRSKPELRQPLLSREHAKLRGRGKTENWDSPLMFALNVKKLLCNVSHTIWVIESNTLVQTNNPKGIRIISNTFTRCNTSWGIIQIYPFSVVIRNLLTIAKVNLGRPHKRPQNFHTVLLRSLQQLIVILLLILICILCNCSNDHCHLFNNSCNKNNIVITIKQTQLKTVFLVHAFTAPAWSLNRHYFVMKKLYTFFLGALM